jgi:hypothetical protein
MVGSSGWLQKQITFAAMFGLCSALFYDRQLFVLLSGLRNRFKPGGYQDGAGYF